MRRGVGLLVVAFVLAAAKAAVSAAPLAVVRLPAHASVAGPDILLGEIAVIESDDEELAEKLAQLSVGRAAIPGQSRDVSVATVRVRMRQQSLPEKQIVIEAENDGVAVTTRARTVSGEALMAVAEAAVLADAAETTAADAGGAPADIVLTCSNPGSATVADGELELVASRVIGTPPGPMVVSVDIVVDGDIHRTVMVRCDAVVALDVLVTTASLQRHDVLDESNTAMERREFASLPRRLLPPDAVFGGEAPTWRVTRPLAAGTVLTESMVETVPLVARGAPVQIVAAGAHVFVSAPGVALEDGRLGDVIQVRNSSSGQIIRARVAGADLVEVVF